MTDIPTSLEPTRSPWRVPMAIATAAIVTVTAYLSGWNAYRNWEWNVYSPQSSTWKLLTGLRNHVEQHQQTTGHLPATLDDLEIVKKQEVFMGANGLARDCWNNPVQYKVDGDKFVVFSYGADGQPGGTGEDLDLYSDQEPDFEKLSFWDYTMSPRTTGMKLCCLVGGLLAFPLCLIPSRPRSRVGVVKVVAMHLVTAILSIVVAAVISVVHLPSGH